MNSKTRPTNNLDDYFTIRTPIFEQLGFTTLALPALREYLNLLWHSNQDLNLFSRQMTIPELVDNHVIDCMLALPHVPKNVKKVADFGTGGGLPGIIFALQFPKVRFVLFEKSPKKRKFLELCLNFTKNIQMEGEIPKDLDQFDLVTCRAFKPIDVILEMSRSYFQESQKSGHYFLLKARKEKIDEELMLAKQKFPTLDARCIALSSPVLTVERHVVLIRRES